MSLYCLIPILWAVAQAPSNANPDLNSTVVWRAERVCGVNCLYLMLRANDKYVDYPVLQKTLLSEELNSLTDLKRAAEARGLPTCIARTDPAGLRSLSKPFIAHMELVGVRGVASAHFVLVTQADVDNVTYIDGTTAEPVTATWKDFSRDWSGHALIAPASNRQRFWPYAAFAAVGLGAAFVVEKLKRNSSKPFSEA